MKIVGIAKAFVLIVLVCVGTPCLVEAATYYVADSGGSDSRTCANAQTIGTPKRTITSTLSCLAAGDTLLIRTGIYQESFYDAIPAGTSWGNAVTISSFTGETVTIRPSSGFQVMTFGSVRGSATKYIIISGITIDGKNVTNDAIKIDCTSTTCAEHIRVQNCIIENAGGNGFLVDGAVGGNEFLNNEVTGNGTAFFATGRGHGFYIASANNIIDGNHIHDNSFGNFSNGIQIYNYGHLDENNNIIRNNTIHNHAYGNGIVLGSGSGNVAYNNVLYGGDNISIGFGCNGCKAYNNTITGAAKHPVQINNATATMIQNNIFWSNGYNTVSNGDTGDGTCGGCTKDPNATIDHNLSTDPKFASGTFLLTAGSPAIDAGVLLSAVTTDFSGGARPLGNGQDLGAFEYGSSAVALSATKLPAPQNLRNVP